MSQNINPLNSASGTYSDDSRDTRSPREKWDQRNKESKARQRLRRKRNGGTDDNTGNKPIQDNGIDGVPRNPFVSSTSSGGDIEFNGSVLICINGSPYYIDIPYDSDTGAYAASGGANFPIT